MNQIIDFTLDRVGNGGGAVGSSVGVKSDWSGVRVPLSVLI